MSDAPAPRRRLAAIAAIAAYVAAVVTLVWALYDDVLALLLALAAIIAAAIAGWLAITRRGLVRGLSTGCAVVLLAGALVALIIDGTILEIVLVVSLAAVASGLARYALAVDKRALRNAPVPGTPAPRPGRPVLLMNPRSGGGKVVTFNLAEEARSRGVEPVMLEPGDDLEALARDAVARGADVLGMAGGDGSQALVASIASEHGLPYVCIPAGTRNHLALDLGVDRNDCVGSLDAFVHGYERTIDLARVNGRVFVNNASLGVYAEIVQSDAYRDAKLQTAAEMLPGLLGPDATHFSFELDLPSGEVLKDACLVLVSNNEYELERLGGFGTRARIDEGTLGVIALHVDGSAAVAKLVSCELAGRVSAYDGWHQWTTTSLEIRSDGPVAVGVDGEALTFPSPLHFEIEPAALRVRLAPDAPGQSRAAVSLTQRRGGIHALARVAAGRAPRG